MSTTTVESVKPPKGKPKWLRVKLPTGKKYTQLRNLVDTYDLHTICTSGSCPNMGECWGEGTATFMILGNVCTRSCGFCGVKTGRPEEVDWAEPEKVARSIKIMGIRHAVITSVDRDDLKDMGSILWAETVKAIRRMNPETTLETSRSIGKMSAVGLVMWSSITRRVRSVRAASTGWMCSSMNSMVTMMMSPR